MTWWNKDRSCGICTLSWQENKWLNKTIVCPHQELDYYFFQAKMSLVLNVRICWFTLSCMMGNDESLDFGLFLDKISNLKMNIFGCGKLWLAFFTISCHFMVYISCEKMADWSIMKIISCSPNRTMTNGFTPNPEGFIIKLDQAKTKDD